VKRQLQAGKKEEPMQEHPDTHGGVTPMSRGTTDSSDGQHRPDGEMLDQARDSALTMVEQARETAGDMVGQLKQQASTRLAGQIERVTTELRGASTSIRTVGKDLREHDQAMLGGYADTIAHHVNRAAGYLAGKDLDQLIDDTERLARSRPGLFLGGAFILGLAAARFLKSGPTPELIHSSNTSFNDGSMPDRSASMNQDSVSSVPTQGSDQDAHRRAWSA
jgi:hypothetical protein